ncbi:beta-1,3-galactosyltransferase 1-like [Penaeus monodon]|uniref:beta-1,3-galactosyltransferase 1-like n=1 Tax=Penaeus monodon TaxID=6687 RepID=UPI0018A7538F|nr:beta-1,3-galactosyltransferase 1-like [Penaeus monodon]
MTACEGATPQQTVTRRKYRRLLGTLVRFVVFLLVAIPASLAVSVLLSKGESQRIPDDPWKPLPAPPCGRPFLGLCPQSLDTILLADFLNGTKISRKREKETLSNTKSSWGRGIPAFMAPSKIPIKYLIVEERFCRVADVEVIIYVHTAPRNAQRRDVIRSTWADPRWYPMVRHKVIFVIGQSREVALHDKLREESVTYHDIVVADFVDSYRNLSYKALTAMHWIREYCKGAKYIVKTDDDVFINIFALDRFLNHAAQAVDRQRGTESSKQQKEEKSGKSPENKESSSGKTLLEEASKRLKRARPEIQCLVWEGMTVLRDKKSKWYVDQREYGNRTYPPYCSGNAFLMTWSTAHALLHASTTTPFLWVDDAYLTGVLAKAAKVNFVKRNSLYELNGNKFVESLIKGEKVFLHHPQHDPATTREMWNVLLNKEMKDNFLNHIHESH